jgi:hypothetical protein
MVSGSVLGLIAYFTLGWYTASLIGTAVSFVVMMISLAVGNERFDWARLRGAPGGGEG